VLTIEDVAKACHEANRALCEAVGDRSQRPWAEAEPWRRESAVAGVEFRYANPDATPADQHEAWSAAKRAAGWGYGPEKDPAALRHPCLVPYDDLPPEQRAKDSLFAAVAAALRPLVGA